jgi:hypothetical protein
MTKHRDAPAPPAPSWPGGSTRPAHQPRPSCGQRCAASPAAPLISVLLQLPQHQLLQVPDHGQVPFLCRLEDPLPQPPYGALVKPPINGLPVEDHVLRSVHMRCPTRPSVPVDQGRIASTAHLLTSALPSEPGHTARYPASYPDTATWRSRHGVLVSCRLSSTGIGFLSILFPPEDSALLTVGLPDRRPGGPGLCRSFRVPHA